MKYRRLKLKKTQREKMSSKICLVL